MAKTQAALKLIAASAAAIIELTDESWRRLHRITLQMRQE